MQRRALILSCRKGGSRPYSFRMPVKEMFKKVLMAIDASSVAMELFNCIPDLRTMGMEELLIVHVVPAEELYDKGINKYRPRFQKLVKGKVDTLIEEGITARFLIEKGHPPPRRIVQLAEEEDVDLILIGSVGESIIREILVGSTTREVVRLSKQPVLVEKFITLGMGTPYIPMFSKERSSILLPTDFSEASEVVYNKFLEHAERLRRVILMHVIQVVEESYIPDDLKKKKEKAEHYLKSWQQKFTQKGVRADIKLLEGVPSKQIIEVSEYEGATLIAMPTWGLGGAFTSFIVGSTADAVVRNSSRSILFIK